MPDSFKHTGTRMPNRDAGKEWCQCMYERQKAQLMLNIIRNHMEVSDWLPIA
jgi:hypothetical protein